MAKTPSGPIPGENYTSDTKNYPWHRPPTYTDPNEAFEYIAAYMTDEEASVAILTMLEMGATVRDVTDMLVTGGIGGGKWSVDYGLILAGPIANTICLMAKKYGVDYDLGLKKNAAPYTKSSLRAFEKIDAGAAEQAGADVGSGLGLGGINDAGATQGNVDQGGTAANTNPKGGFGGMPKISQRPGGIQEQQAMLGRTDPTEGEGSY